jgi:hypothetical protein
MSLFHHTGISRQEQRSERALGMAFQEGAIMTFSPHSSKRERCHSGADQESQNLML